MSERIAAKEKNQQELLADMDRLLAASERDWDDPDTPFAAGYITSVLAQIDNPPVATLDKYLGLVHRGGLRSEETFGSYAPSTVTNLKDLPAVTIRRMGEDESTAVALEAILSHAVQEGVAKQSSFDISQAVRLLDISLGVDSVASPEAQNAGKAVVREIIDAIKSDKYGLVDLYDAEDRIGSEGSRGHKDSAARRRWMADTIAVVEGITPEQADDLTYSMAMSIMGSYKLDRLKEVLEEFNVDRVELLAGKVGIHEVGLYSREQLERMYAVATENETEIDRLRQHDVSVVFVAREGDHNGINNEVAEKLDGQTGRTLFFEINRPEQIYRFMKYLDSLGINPSTLIFASHGSPGQFIVQEKTPLGADGGDVMHVVSVHPQDFLDPRANESLKGYSVDRSYGFLRAVQRFMQPSRGIDDPEGDIGRKKIISLSCDFDGVTERLKRGSDGDYVRDTGNRTTLLRSLGEFVARKLPGEHIDIYGAEISTNSQIRTEKGFQYNQLDEEEGVYHSYPASVIRIDTGQTSWHQQDEIELRR